MHLRKDFLHFLSANDLASCFAIIIPAIDYKKRFLLDNVKRETK